MHLYKVWFHHPTIISTCKIKAYFGVSFVFAVFVWPYLMVGLWPGPLRGVGPEAAISVYYWRGGRPGYKIVRFYVFRDGYHAPLWRASA